MAVWTHANACLQTALVGTNACISPCPVQARAHNSSSCQKTVLTLQRACVYSARSRGLLARGGNISIPPLHSNEQLPYPYL